MALSKFSIINQDLADYLWLWSGQDGVIEYYIFDEGSPYLDNSISMSNEEASFIRELFSEIGDSINLDFIETDNFLTSDIDIATTSYYSGLFSDYLGALYSDNYSSDSESKFVASWLNDGSANLTNLEKEIITHEIGHALGLDHPYGDGFYEGATSSDTVMSYRDFNSEYDGFTDVDIAALQELWGIADAQELSSYNQFTGSSKPCSPPCMNGGYFPEATYLRETNAACEPLFMIAAAVMDQGVSTASQDIGIDKFCEQLI